MFEGFSDLSLYNMNPIFILSKTVDNVTTANTNDKGENELNKKYYSSYTDRHNGLNARV